MSNVNDIAIKILKETRYFIKEILYLSIHSLIEAWHFIGIALKYIIFIIIICSGMTILITHPLWSKYNQIAEEKITNTGIEVYRQYVVPELNKTEAKTLFSTTDKYIIYKDIPRIMKQTMIYNVDPTFETNKGIDWYRLRVALEEIKNTQGNVIKDTDTITEKAVESVFLKEEKGVDKFCEKIAMALKMDKAYSKDTILEIYFNVTDCANDIKGIQQAAYKYFGKDVRKLTIKQQIYICTIMLDSRDYNPNEEAESVLKKCNELIDDLYAKGLLTWQQYIGAKNERIVFKEQNKYQKEEKPKEESKIIVINEVIDTEKDEETTNTKDTD